MITFSPTNENLGTSADGASFSHTLSASSDVGSVTSFSAVFLTSPFDTTLSVGGSSAVFSGPGEVVPARLDYIPLGEVDVVPAGKWSNLPAQIQHMIGFQPGSLSATIQIRVTAGDADGTESITYTKTIQTSYDAGKARLLDAVNNREQG